MNFNLTLGSAPRFSRHRAMQSRISLGRLAALGLMVLLAVATTKARAAASLGVGNSDLFTVDTRDNYPAGHTIAFGQSGLFTVDTQDNYPAGHTIGFGGSALFTVDTRDNYPAGHTIAFGQSDLFTVDTIGVSATPNADSTTNFAGLQGSNGWYYGYFNSTDALPYTPSDFKLMTNFDGTSWFIASEFWTSLNASGGHPNGASTSGGRTPANHWPVRRWVSTYSGPVRVSGYYRDNDNLGPNTVRLHIFVDGVESLTVDVPDDSTLRHYSFNTTVSVGSILDFAVDPLGDDRQDGFTFTSRIDLPAEEGSCVPVPGGAVAWWRAEGNLTDTVDSHDGTGSGGGPAFVTGQVGQAFDFDGVDDFVRVPYSSDFDITPSGFTVELWFNASSNQFSGDGQMTLVDKSHGGIDSTGWVIQGRYVDGILYFLCGDGGPGITSFLGAGTTTNVLDEFWHHFAGIYNGAELQVFLDGELRSTTSFTNTVANNTRDLLLGKHWSLGRNFHGLEDEVTIYQRALGSNEVRAIYLAGAQGKCPPFADYGDAPESYRTTRTNSGPWHVIVPGIYLGTSVDAEFDGFPSAAATGDDSRGSDDEDGVTFTSALVRGSNANVRVVASTNGYLQGWLDSSGNGQFETPEQIFTNVPLGPGTNFLSFTVPFVAVPGSTYARFRFSTATNLPPTGPAPDGEVEDYAVTIVAGTIQPCAIRQALAGYWPFDGDGADSSGSSRDVTLEGGVGFGTGLFGQALDLHHDDSQYADRLASDSVFDFGASNFTVQVWVNINVNSDVQVLVEKFSGATGPGWTFVYRPSFNDLHFYASPNVISVGLTMSTGVWHHVVARHDSGTLSLFYDGTLLGSVPFGDFAPSPNPLLIGRRNSGDGRELSMDGRLDEVAIWRRALTDTEITTLYNGGIGMPLGAGTNCPAPALADYGDAPESYQTTRTNSGPWHIIVPGIHLGTSVDAESDGAPDSTATGDDTAGFDDEDGVTFTSSLVPGSTASIQVVASTNGYLQGWIDFGRDGHFETVEQIFTNVSLAAGTNELTFAVPGLAATGDTYARFRFSTATNLPPTGPAPNGEVEDYLVSINPFVPPSTNRVSITISNGLPVLNWGGSGIVLECATSIAGPWVEVMGATNGYRIQVEGSQKFFRLRITQP